VSALQALDVGGSRDGCYVAVCSARSGCLRRGVVHKDGKCSAGHAGVGLGWQSGKLTFTHGPAALISFINELEEISGIGSRSRAAGPCRHRPASLNPANEAHRVVGLQQGPPELAWSARSECTLRASRFNTQAAATPTLDMPTSLGPAHRA
jgi:hypothetical protein